MNTSGHGERAKQWLEEQLELLGNLRNANPRDPSFKLWRQNTLTVLQRIWPGEQARSERFRRIAFSPSTSRSDFRTTRDWYTRGCADATEFLRVLLSEVDAVGVPEPMSTSAPAPQLASGAEDDFPVLDLPAEEAGPGPGAASSDMRLLDSDGIAASLAPAADPPAKRDPAAPAPPRLRVPARAPAAPPPPATPDPAPPTLPADAGSQLPGRIESFASRPVSSAPAPHDTPASDGDEFPPHKPGARTGERRMTPTDRRTTARRTKSRRAEVKPKLKDLLGLQDMGHAGPAPAAPAPSAPAPSAASPRAARPAPAAPPAPPAAVRPPAPPAPPVSAAPASRAAIQPPAPPAPPAGHAEGEDVAQVTADFLRNSPVLGLQGRPVQRSSDATRFLDPDAVAIATLAAELARHVSHEPAREPLRLALLQLATQVEAHAPEWASLREAVTKSMAYPELARRLMPVVLPWLGRAA